MPSQPLGYRTNARSWQPAYFNSQIRQQCDERHHDIDQIRVQPSLLQWSQAQGRAPQHVPQGNGDTVEHEVDRMRVKRTGGAMLLHAAQAAERRENRGCERRRGVLHARVRRFETARPCLR